MPVTICGLDRNACRMWSSVTAAWELALFGVAFLLTVNAEFRARAFIPSRQHIHHLCAVQLCQQSILSSCTTLTTRGEQGTTWLAYRVGPNPISVWPTRLLSASYCYDHMTALIALGCHRAVSVKMRPFSILLHIQVLCATNRRREKPDWIEDASSQYRKRLSIHNIGKGDCVT